MTALTKPRMTVDEFLTWAEGNPGRHELFRGEVYAMAPETVGHVERKGAVYLALRTAIQQRSLPCHVMPDGGTVRIDDTTAYEPDALVYCGGSFRLPRLRFPIRLSSSRCYRLRRASSTSRSSSPAIFGLRA